MILVGRQGARPIDDATMRFERHAHGNYAMIIDGVLVDHFRKLRTRPRRGPATFPVGSSPDAFEDR
ncbi:MAG: hypothetical protein BJ554DRAFT_1267 [Olpidium bornovanus]|uniref:Uncharacterized protein n=1 Tax=Olpidium bornovanus TaxID=278681 RepID=A0A8H7ZSK0_9FUNG|nr:MAG: hypothetical protein BJ554DRAFT_1267 [Olpidium bornovanus]